MKSTNTKYMAIKLSVLMTFLFASPYLALGADYVNSSPTTSGYSLTGTNTILNTSTIITSGATAQDIFINNSTGTTITNSGTGSVLRANGSNADGIYLPTATGPISITNQGTIQTTGDFGIPIYIPLSTASSISINNSGNILASTPNYQAIYIPANSSTTVSLTNSGTISGVNGALYFPSISSLALVNSGTITSSSPGTATFYNVAPVTSLVNSGSITNTGGTKDAIRNDSSIDIFSNTGTVRSTNNNPSAALNNFGTITSLTNSNGGVMDAYIGIHNQAAGVITTLTNTATITGGDYGIINYGAINTFNNGQGAGNTNGPLTFFQNLPTNYNIIINSKTSYGQLAVNGVSGVTTFGIYSGGVAGVAASTLNKGTYSSVLSGVLASNLNNIKGNYNGFAWSLNNSSGTIWDLLVTGASTADTQQSLVNTSAALQNTFTLQNSVLANSFTYDCNVFGANDVCVSAGGRNTAVSAANGLNNTSALLIAAYRVMPTVRVGAYADQNLSVNNAGSTINLGNNTPLIGLFGAWNERLDGTGTEVKISAAYGQKNATVTRQVVGTSEAGSGSSQLNSQGAQVAAKYGFAVAESTIVSPYVGVRYTQNNMGGYTEQTTSSVTAPLTYSALNTNATTALAGVGAQYRFIPQAAVFASAGVETDTSTSNGTYSATGIVGTTPINFNANPVKTRPTATLGAYYDVEKNQRVGITGIYRQEPYQAVQTTTLMATYTVGL